MNDYNGNGKRTLRRRNGRNFKNGLAAQSPTYKLKNVKIKTMTGAKLKALSSDAYITNDQDQDAQQAQSDYLEQASDLQNTVENLSTYKGGLPHPSSVGMYYKGTNSGEVTVHYANNIYEGVSTTPACDGTDPFNGMLEIRGIQVANNTSSDTTVNLYISGYPGDGTHNTQSYFILYAGTVAGNTQKTIDMSEFFGGPLLMQSNRVMLVTQVTGSYAVVTSLLYGVVSYNGADGG